MEGEAILNHNICLSMAGLYKFGITVFKKNPGLPQYKKYSVDRSGGSRVLDRVGGRGQKNY